MARGKHYSKESEIGRQCGERLKKKYNNSTLLHLRAKVNKENELEAANEKLCCSKTK